MNYNNLSNYYSTIFSMKQHHGYSITEIENLIPFERELYLNMLISYLQELEARTQKENNERILNTFKTFKT